ncbi:aldo/keto reductase [Arsenicitalea aurantiaca]|uniref:Aldo/keto reductase n=1 Tax=Arsenicitalea aurantiaca TaxID=1783274 RepID=A0A433X890_9HYPH|nr:aldo/keto reductase [Arsenicitalea aurantiaca]RUT30279.1 aldo/keto reductase [Arsenicitalea aurantiaca]
MQRRPIGRSELVIEPLVFGGNVLGWTLEEDAAFDVLDAYLEAGFTAIDTADMYGKGRSEEILGRWMKSRGNRAQIHLFTKLGSEMGPGKKGLSADYVREAVEASLSRLQTDYIDLYQCHRPDPETGHEETLRAMDVLVRSGKVRAIGTSNYTAEMIREAREISIIKSLPRYESEQPLYNLYDRESFEGPLQQACIELEIGVLPYFSLAAGFLTGKYRTDADFKKGARGPRVEKYNTDKGRRILAALDAVSDRTGASPAEISLAWLVAQPGVTAPIASATSLEQLKTLVAGVSLKLSEEDLETLTQAGR